MVRVLDSKNGNLLTTLQGHSGPVLDACWSPAGDRIASAGADNTIRIWDAVTGRDILTLSGHDRQVTTICFGPEGYLLASGSYDATVRLWDARPLDADEKK